MNAETVIHGQKEELTLSKHNYSQYSNKNRNSNKPNNNPANKPKKENVATFGNVAIASDIKPTTVAELEAKTQIASNIPTPEVKMVKETVETVALPATAEGFVVDCARLNVRAEANINSEVVYVLDSMSEIEVDMSKSTNEWLHICTASGVEGYCMRKYVEVRL